MTTNSIFSKRRINCRLALLLILSLATRAVKLSSWTGQGCHSPNKVISWQNWGKAGVHSRALGNDLIAQHCTLPPLHRKSLAAWWLRWKGPTGITWIAESGLSCECERTVINLRHYQSASTRRKRGRSNDINSTIFLHVCHYLLLLESSSHDTFPRLEWPDEMNQSRLPHWRHRETLLQFEKYRGTAVTLFDGLLGRLSPDAIISITGI